MLYAPSHERPIITNMNIGLSLMNNSTADKFPKIMFITKKKNAPTLRVKIIEEEKYFNLSNGILSNSL